MWLSVCGAVATTDFLVTSLYQLALLLRPRVPRSSLYDHDTVAAGARHPVCTRPAAPTPQRGGRCAHPPPAPLSPALWRPWCFPPAVTSPSVPGAGGQD